MSANVGHMFYYGEIPWHKMGEKLEQPATLEEALSHGELNWEVELVELRTVDNLEVPMRQAVVRPCLQKPSSPWLPRTVLGVVHPGFKPLQNRQGAEVFDAIFGRGERVYHTGGYLGNGEVIWLQARLPEAFTLAGEDIIEPHILYSNSHNGSRAIDFRLTTVRVVCQNTLNLALQTRDRSKIFKRSHQGSYANLQKEFEQFFNFTIDALKIVHGRFDRLSQTRCEADAFGQFVDAIFPQPAPPTSDKPALQKAYETLKEQVEISRRAVAEGWDKANDDGTISVRGTWWGALNAVTAYVDHDLATRRSGYAFAMFGRGDALKRQAYKLAVEGME